MVPTEADLRRSILSVVEDFPGLHLRAIQRRVGCTAMVAEYHLNILERLGLVRSSVQDRYRVFFPVEPGPVHLDAKERKWLVLLRRPNILGMTLFLLEHGPMRPGEIAESLAMPASTASYQFQKMWAVGMLTRPLGEDAITLVDPDRTIAILQAYKPTKDTVARYANLWRSVFDRPDPRIPATIPDHPDVPGEILELPRSAQKVYLVLLEGRKTQQELCKATGLARRTVYKALGTLMDIGLVKEQARMGDARMNWYWIADGSLGTAAPDQAARSD